jgi:hypothetical protein
LDDDGGRASRRGAAARGQRLGQSEQQAEAGQRRHGALEQRVATRRGQIEHVVGGR